MDGLQKSLSATLREKELKKRRQERISQVRLQTNSWIAKSRENFNAEKSKQLSQIISEVSSELSRKAVQDLEVLTAQHDKELDEVGLAHRAAAGLDDLEQIQSQEQIRNEELAKDRFRDALRTERKVKEAKRMSSIQLQKRKSEVRVLEDYKAKFLVDRKPYRSSTSADNQSKPKSKKDDYQQNLANQLHIPPSDQSEEESTDQPQHPKKRKIRKKRLHSHTKRKSKKRKSPIPKPVVPGGFSKVVEATKRNSRKARSRKKKKPVPASLPVHPTSKRRHRLLHKKKKESEVIYYDASLPQPQKPQKFIAPPGIARIEVIDENRPNAWELGEELTEETIQEMAARSAEVEKDKKAAEKRGIIAMRKAKLEQRYKQLEAELTSDSQFPRAADPTNQAQFGVPSVNVLKSPVLLQKRPSTRLPKIKDKEQSIASPGLTQKEVIDAGSQTRLHDAPVKIVKGPSLVQKPHSTPKRKTKHKEQSIAPPQMAQKEVIDVASQARLNDPAVKIIKEPVLVQKPHSTPKPKTKDKEQSIASSGIPQKEVVDAASQASHNAPPVTIVKGPVLVQKPPSISKPKVKGKSITPTRIDRNGVNDENRESTLEFEGELTQETVSMDSIPADMEKDEKMAEKRETVPKKKDKLQQHYKQLETELTSNSQFPRTSDATSQTRLDVPPVKILQGPVLVQKPQSIPKPKRKDKEQSIAPPGIAQKEVIDATSQTRHNVPPVKIVKDPVLVHKPHATPPKPKVKEMKEKEQFNAAFMEALRKNFGTMDSSTTPEQDTSTSIENYSPSETPLTTKKAMRHYIKKLLLMRPESIEALKSYSASSTTESSPSSMVHVNTSAIGSIVMSSTTSSERLSTVHSTSLIPIQSDSSQTPEIHVNVQYESATTTSSSSRVLSDRTNMPRPPMPLPLPVRKPSDLSLAGILSKLCHHQEYCLAASIIEDPENPEESSEGDLVSFQGQNLNLDSNSPFMNQMRLEAITSPEQLEHIRKGGNAANFGKSGTQSSSGSEQPSRELNRGMVSSDIRTSSKQSLPKPLSPPEKSPNPMRKVAMGWATVEIPRPPWLNSRFESEEEEE